MVFAKFIRGALRPALFAAFALGVSWPLAADELSDAVNAAEAAATKAEKLAAQAMSAASAARAAGDANKAAAAAMDAGSAAREAAQAARALALVAKSASMSSDAQGTAAPASSQSTGTAQAKADEQSTQVAAASPAAAASGESGYADHVQCEGKSCQVDLFLTKGFRAFSQCQVCHGLDANGSSFAPSLNDKLQEIDKARFVDVVTNGYKGQVGVMPPWKTNPNVMKYIENLYAYLMARSDNVVPAGKLKRYDR